MPPTWGDTDCVCFHWTHGTGKIIFFFKHLLRGIEPKGLNMFKSIGLGLDMDPVQGLVRWLLEHCRNLKQSQRSLGKFDAK